MPVVVNVLSEGSLILPDFQSLSIQTLLASLLFGALVPALLVVTIAIKVRRDGEKMPLVRRSSSKANMAEAIFGLMLWMTCLSLLTLFFQSAAVSLEPLLPLINGHLRAIQTSEVDLQVPRFLTPADRLARVQESISALRSRADIRAAMLLDLHRYINSAVCKGPAGKVEKCFPGSLLIGDELGIELMQSNLVSFSCDAFSKTRPGNSIPPAYLDASLALRSGVPRKGVFHLKLIKSHSFQNRGELRKGFSFAIFSLSRVLIPHAALPAMAFHLIAEPQAKGKRN